jgi:hypothetical protein
VNEESERIWKEAFVAWFKVLSWHFALSSWPKPRKTSVAIADLQADVWTRKFPNTKQESWPLGREFRRTGIRTGLVYIGPFKTQPNNSHVQLHKTKS